MKQGMTTCKAQHQTADMLWGQQPGLCTCSLHTVHDEEKPFELEMAWICDDSKKQFVKVPADLLQEADKAAKDALNSGM